MSLPAPRAWPAPFSRPGIRQQPLPLLLLLLLAALLLLLLCSVSSHAKPLPAHPASPSSHVRSLFARYLSHKVHKKRTPKYKCNCETLKAQVKKVYQYIIQYGAKVLSGQVPIDSLWAPNAKGRFTPVGNFDTREGVLEYFYALGASLGVVSVDFTKLVCSCENQPPMVASEANGFINKTGMGVVPHNVTQFGFWTFSSTNATIVSVELLFRELGYDADPTTDAQRLAKIQTVCTIATLGYPDGNGNTMPGSCVNYQNLTLFSGNTPAEQFQDCVQFLSTIPYGTLDRAFSNSTTCRVLHVVLTMYNPVHHCPHVGKTGGSACIYHSYASWYDKTY